MNNGLIEYKKSFVSKIKDFLKNLFGMKKANDVIPKVEDEVAVINDRTNKFLNEIRVENNDLEKLIDKKDFLNFLDGNEEALKKLSIDKLEKLIKYYDGVIEKNDKLIKRMKKSA